MKPSSMRVVQIPNDFSVPVPRPPCGPYIPATGQPVGWTVMGEDADSATVRSKIRAEEPSRASINVMDYESNDYTK